MPWNEFCSYLAGIMPDTPLGNIVQIRSEEDENILKGFSKEQKAIRTKWRTRMAKAKSKQEVDEAILFFQNMFKELSKGGE